MATRTPSDPSGRGIPRRSVLAASLGVALTFALYAPAAPPVAAASTSPLTVQHGANPNVARPRAYVVTWIGSVRPTQARDNDRWLLA